MPIIEVDVVFGDEAVRVSGPTVPPLLESLEYHRLPCAE